MARLSCARFLLAPAARHAEGFPPTSPSCAPTSSLAYARPCGVAPSRAHARPGDRTAIAAYLGKTDPFDRAVAAFALRYARPDGSRPRRPCAAPSRRAS
ncbi:DUF2252 family protein [Streptomyces sp. KL116D]|uniref:DUF2252 family protein n=1 Tax=Streptomyces sp. KL116D TaxID=3045152 RepID=UPI0035565E52